VTRRRWRSVGPESRSGPSRRRVTQETVDAMEHLRRQGLTFEEIGARLGCSERTARRYAGNVEPRLELPAKRPRLDPEALREQLTEHFARAAWSGWKRWPSTEFVNEVNRQVEERLAAMRPETLRLLAEDQRMRGQLFAQVVAPLYRDFRTYQGVDQFMGQFPDTAPLFWLPAGQWVRGDPDEADEAP
jgi:hypothetical protein